ncbi:chemotaxis protein CheA [Fundidesulfovibrio butyratiphilus]
MSQDFMDPELFADFIVEAKEHLETIEPNLLELERNPANLGLLNEIFRPMHSLKGASGFLALNSINGLAHKSENILDELRKGKIAVTPEIMDVILASTDALRTMIDNLETTGSEGQVDTSYIIARIEAILAGEPFGQPATPASPEQVDASGPQGQAASSSEDDIMADQSGADQAGRSQGVAESGGRNETGQAASPAEVRGFMMPELHESGPAYPLQAIGEGHLNDFLEEAREIIENLNVSLLELEKDPEAGGELVNDIFRYFHNIKGNSGIIGHKELNALTHEAETLLNRVRKGELKASRPMIDLLLAAVDLIESLLTRIDPKHNEAIPVDIAFLVEKLKKASETGEVDLGGGASGATPDPHAEPAPQADENEPSDGLDPEDVEIFEQTVQQQLEKMHIALAELAKDGTNKDYIDGLFRTLDTIRNSAGYMGFSDLKVYAERTAGLVDQGRKSGISFELMLDILKQECAILEDMLRKVLTEITGKPADEIAPAPEEPAAPPTPDVVLSAAPMEPDHGHDAHAPQADGPKAESSQAQEAAKTVAPPPVEPEPTSAVPSAPKGEPVAKAAPGPETSAAPAAKPAPTPPRQPAKPAAKPTAKPAAKPAATPAKPEAAPNQAAGGTKVSSTIRVDHEKLDHLMNLIGELIINRNRYSLLARSLEEGKLDVQAIAQQLTETTYAMARLSDDLQDTIMKVRMVPVSSVFSRFPRLVRDLSRKSGKEVELLMEGEETELDKSVVEVIGDPLVHLIRNSVDHGLEPEDVRLAAGKSAMGHVWLRAYHRGNSVAIEVEDDGKGIDPAVMREVAVRKGLIGPDEAKNLDDRDSLELIFMPGFSSAEKITDISGRGVGMDVVRTNIKNLKGMVNVVSEVGKGSKFTMTLPLTLAIIDALMVMVGNETYAIPLDAVSETTKIEMARMTEINKRKAVTLRGEVLGVVEMREVLGLDPDPEADQREVAAVVILHDNDRRLGVIVDRLLERQEIVIKPLGAYLSEFDMRGISGATIMGDGSVVLILDPHELYLMSTSQRSTTF